MDNTFDPNSVMMDLSKQTEASEIAWAPGGRYQVRILECTPTLAKTSGAPMLQLKGEIVGGEFEGITFNDNIIIAAGAKGAGFGKKKLRGLIGDLVDREGQTPAIQIANMLVGKVFLADLGTDVRQAKNKDTGELTPLTVIIDGKQVQAMQNKVESYYSATHATTATQVQAQAPVQTQVQVGAQGTVPFQGVPQGFPQQQQFAQPQFAGGVPQGVPGGFAAPVNGTAPVAQGVPPWATQPVAAAPTTGRRGK